ncbi:MAG: TPM domain-containing protein [Campylobacter sp.]|nr:TPM domain-containing protein [Campylobacter sp.]
MKKFILGVIFVAQTLLFADQVILKNDDILHDEAVAKIELIGNELLNKTGIFVGIVALDSLNGESISSTMQKYANTIPYQSYAFILFSKNDKKVEIYQTGDLLNDFDKEQVLSPYPSKGTILPILVSKKDDSVYAAALLNGYADIAEQIAAKRGVELENAIGNTNKNMLNFFRFIIYGSVLLVFGVYLYYRFKGKK